MSTIEAIELLVIDQPEVYQKSLRHYLQEYQSQLRQNNSDDKINRNLLRLFTEDLEGLFTKLKNFII